MRLFGGRCLCCGTRAIAPAPAGLEPGLPFGRSVGAVVVTLHHAHAIGLERLRAVMGELFGLPVGEGALCSILARARTPLERMAGAIAARVRHARVVCEL